MKFCYRCGGIVDVWNANTLATLCEDCDKLLTTLHSSSKPPEQNNVLSVIDSLETVPQHQKTNLAKDVLCFLVNSMVACSCRIGDGVQKTHAVGNGLDLTALDKDIDAIVKLANDYNTLRDAIKK